MLFLKTYTIEIYILIMNHLFDLNINSLGLITEFLDAKTLINDFDSTCKDINTLAYKIYGTSSSLDRKINILNNIKKIKKIEYEEYKSKIFNNYLLNLSNNNVIIYNFLLQLLKTEMFYIGGSFSLLMAHLFKNKKYDKSKYADSDIDIYLIGNININLIQNILSNILIKYIENLDIKCFIKVKKYLINIEFEDPNIKKIQIILHVRNSINEYMEFLDFPITQFLLGYNKLYYTKLALFALETKINIIDNIYNNLSYNRIEKYHNRGFYTVRKIKYGINLKQRIIAIYEPIYYPINITKHKIDCNLSHLLTLKSMIENKIEAIGPINELATIIDSNRINNNKIITNYNITEFNRTTNTTLFLYLFDMKLLLESIRRIDTTKSFKKTFRYRYPKYNDEYRYYPGYEDEYRYHTEEIIKIYHKTIIQFDNKKYNKQNYKDNERNPNINSYSVYEFYYNNNNKQNYLYYKILTLSEFSLVKKNIFFNNYCTYFLNNNLCKFGIDNKYHNIFSMMPWEKKSFIPNWIPNKIIDNDGFTLITRKKK